MNKRYRYVDRRKIARNFRLKDLIHDLDRRLGTETDSSLAARFDVPVSDIAGRRRELGIPPGKSTRLISWTPEMDKLLGTRSDAKIAGQLGLSQASVTRRRNVIGVPAWAPSRNK